MRKTIFFAALSCTLAAGTAQAQKLIMDNGECFVVPSQLTSTGKAILGSYDYNESTHVIKLYDENLKETKSVTLNLPVGMQGRWTEEATVIPTGAKASPDSPDVYTHSADESIDAASIKSIVALANAMNQYYGYEPDGYFHFTGFIDIDGRISCYGGGSVDFYLSNFFDKQYPTEYITLIDGHICNIRRNYAPVYNENEAQWKKVSGEHTYPWISGLDELCYTDYDANISFSEMEPYCSQTLFNDDNGWEFIVPVVKEQISYNDPWIYDPYGENGVLLRREAQQSMRTTALKVVNENGNDILTLELTSIYNIFRLNNKVYVEGGYNDNNNEYYNVVYCLDGKGNAIQTVRTASRPKLANVGDGVIDVNVGGENGHVMLTNMGGSLIDRKQTNGEAVIRLNTRHLPKGIYNVTLQREGHTVANEKVMVK
ncbi:MAG: hypothetical protein K2N13_06860 [Paraprevotella sp.]|nr:hypothetical protein [Paraprevotella sp.]